MSSEFPQLSELGVYLDWKTVGLQPRKSIEAMKDLMFSGVGGMHKSGNLLDTRSQDVYYDSIELIADVLHTDYERIVPIAGRETALNSLATALSNQEVELWAMDDNAIHAPFISRLGKKAKIVDNLGGGFSVASTVSSLTGERSGIEKIDGIKVMDVSFETAIFDLRNMNIEDTIVIAEGSMGMLGPLGSGFMIIGDNVEKYLDNFPVSTLGVASVKISNVTKVKTLDRFLMEPVDLIALHGLAQSMDFVRELHRDILKEHTSHVRRVLKDFPEITEISSPESDHVTFTVDDWNAQEFAIVLSEVSNIQVRGGQLCSHLAIDKLGITDVIRVSMHVATTQKDILSFKEALSELLS